MMIWSRCAPVRSGTPIGHRSHVLFLRWQQSDKPAPPDAGAIGHYKSCFSGTSKRYGHRQTCADTCTTLVRGGPRVWATQAPVLQATARFWETVVVWGVIGVATLTLSPCPPIAGSASRTWKRRFFALKVRGHHLMCTLSPVWSSASTHVGPWL